MRCWINCILKEKHHGTAYDKAYASYQRVMVDGVDIKTMRTGLQQQKMKLITSQCNSANDE